MGFRWGKFFKSRWEYLGPKISNMRSQSFWWWWWCWCWWWCYVKCQRNKLETRWVWGNPGRLAQHQVFSHMVYKFKNCFPKQLLCETQYTKQIKGELFWWLNSRWVVPEAYPHCVPTPPHWPRLQEIAETLFDNWSCQPTASRDSAFRNLQNKR